MISEAIIDGLDGNGLLKAYAFSMEDTVKWRLEHLGAQVEQFNYCVPGCKQNKGVAETAPLTSPKCPPRC